MSAVWFAAPGPLDQPTGGYVYDRRVIEACKEGGQMIHYRELDGSFPEPSVHALSDAHHWLETLDDETTVIIDGLAFGTMPEILRSQADRLTVIALIHHPLGDETGHAPEKRDELLNREVQGLHLASRVVVTSPFTRHRLVELGVDEIKIRVVEPGVDRQPVASGSNSEVAQLLCVASYTRRKGHLVLFDALEQCLDLDWRLTCLGAEGLDSDYEDELKRRAAWFESRAELLGPVSRDEIYAALNRSDIFVLPSYYEGYGMVLSEALSVGLPIISTTGGAIPFTVPDTAGLLVPPGNAPALKEALRQILIDQDIRETLRRGALDARDNLSGWEETAEAFIAAISDIPR